MQPCTLEAYAEAKDLPVAFLEQLGITDTRYAGKKAIRIPYLDEDGSELAVRYRTALAKGPDSDDRFRWRKGSKPVLYGLWRLEHARESGYAFLVEGESDCHTLWHHGLPALGVPGAGAWRNEWAAYLDGLEKLYAVIEPDGGGEAFWERLAASPIREKLHRVDLDGAKDVSELHLSGPDEFRERLEAARAGARAWIGAQDKWTLAHLKAGTLPTRGNLLQALDGRAASLRDNSAQRAEAHPTLCSYGCGLPLWASPARADTFTLRDASFFYSILLEIRGTPVAKR